MVRKAVGNEQAVLAAKALRHQEATLTLPPGPLPQPGAQPMLCSDCSAWPWTCAELIRSPPDRHPAPAMDQSGANEGT